MKTEMILYRQNLVQNGKFANVNDYGWILSDPNIWFKSDGSITMVPGIASGNMRQDFILTQGAKYRIRFNMYNRTAPAIVHVTTPIVNYDPASVIDVGASHVLPVANMAYDVTFISDGNSLMFSFASTFDGTISNVELTEYPEVFNLDVTDNVPVPINFNLDDVFDLTKRKTNWSKSIVLPGTHNNNIAFNHIYKINAESLFNPNLKCRCIIKNNGITVFEGFLCLDDIETTINNKIENIKYSVSVYGESLGIFERLEDKTIKELDFSEYDHEFTEERIMATWKNDIRVLGVSGSNNRNILYTSPSISSIAAVSYNDRYVNYFNTAFVEIIFSAPHSFNEGDYVFLDTDSTDLFGDNQCIGVISNVKIVVAVIKWWTGVTPTLNGVVRKMDYIGIGPWYGMCDNGKYQTQAEAPVLVIGRAYYIEQTSGGDDFTNVGAASNSHGTWFIATGTTPTQWTDPNTVIYQLDPKQKELARHDAFINHWVPTDFIPQIFVYEVFNKLCAMLDILFDCPTFDTQLFKRMTMQLDAKFNLPDVMTSGSLSIGQEYMIYSYLGTDDFTNVGAASNSTGVVFTATSSLPTNWSNGTKIASMVNMNKWLPGMKLKDFFLGVLNLFNLVIVEDKEVKNLIHLVNRDDFYNNSIVNWNDKLSAGDPIKMKLSNKMLPTYYNFKFKDSSDFYNTDYNNDFGNTDNQYGVPQRINRKYGDQPIFNVADFATKNSVVEVAFEPTVMAGPIQPVVSAGTIISQGIYADSDKTLSPTYYADSGAVNIKRTSANRIFLIGIWPTKYPWSMNSEGTPGNDIPDVNDSGVFYNTSFYPWCGHTDKYTQNCIVFGPPLANYSPILTHRKRGLYSRFISKYINLISDVNTRTIECNMVLSASDIYNLDLMDMYQIGDFVVKLNKITDWDVNGSGLCKCEFLTIN